MEDRDRIASQINDVVVRRLFSAGLALKSALGLMDGHRRARTPRMPWPKLDQAIINLRDTVFDTRSTDSQTAARPAGRSSRCGPPTPP